MSSYSTVKAQIAKLEKQAEDLFRKEVVGVIAKAKALINEYGLTAADLGLAGESAVKQKLPKPAGVAKYRDPVSGKTWTGQGKAPRFITEGVAAGKSKADFLIGTKTPAGKSATTTKGPAKPARKTKSKKTRVTKKPAKESVGKESIDALQNSVTAAADSTN